MRRKEMKRKWKHEMRGIKQESSKEIFCTFYPSKNRKKNWMDASRKKGIHFTTVNLLGSFLELFIFEPTEPNYNWNGMIRIMVDIIWRVVLIIENLNSQYLRFFFSFQQEWMYLVMRFLSLNFFSLINSEEFWLTGSLKAERFLFSSCWFFLSSDISSWMVERKTSINEWMHKYTMAGDLNNDNNIWICVGKACFPTFLRF